LKIEGSAVLKSCYNSRILHWQNSISQNIKYYLEPVSVVGFSSTVDAVWTIESIRASQSFFIFPRSGGLWWADQLTRY